MDWKWSLFGSTFALIFLAELGDKTQLAALSLVKNPADRWMVFAGAVAALAASTLIAVLVGGWLSALIPPKVFKIAAGALFLCFGLLSLREAFFAAETAEAAPADAPPAAIAVTGAADTAGAGGADADKASGRHLLDGVRNWRIKTALEAAAAFEAAAAARYREMAGQAAAPALRALLRYLAEDEQTHLSRVTALSGRHGQAELAGEPVAAPPAGFGAGDSPAPDGRDRDAIAALAEQEDATAAFYAVLAERARLPELRDAFRQLAAAERRHAASLRDAAGV